MQLVTIATVNQSFTHINYIKRHKSTKTFLTNTANSKTTFRTSLRTEMTTTCTTTMEQTLTNMGQFGAPRHKHWQQIRTQYDAS